MYIQNPVSGAPTFVLIFIGGVYDFSKFPMSSYDFLWCVCATTNSTQPACVARGMYGIFNHLLAGPELVSRQVKEAVLEQEK